MAYICKHCGLAVFVGYWAGVPVISVEVADDKIKDVTKCPCCGHRLMTLSDLEFKPPKEVKP